ALATIDVVLNSIHMIHSLLQTVLKKHVPPVSDGIAVPPISARQISGDKLSIPHAQTTIETRDSLMGKTVSEALFYVLDVLSQYLMVVHPDAAVLKDEDAEDVDAELKK